MRREGKVDGPFILHMLSPLRHVSPFDVNMALDAGFDTVVPYTGVELGEVAKLEIAGGAKVAGLGLVELWVVLEADLDGAVAVAVVRPNVRHEAGANFDGGCAAKPSLFVEHLHGAELSAEESFNRHGVTA